MKIMKSGTSLLKNADGKLLKVRPDEYIEPDPNYFIFEIQIASEDQPFTLPLYNDGTLATIPYSFETGTSSPPTSKKLRLNNSVFEDVTEIWISDTDYDNGNKDTALDSTRNYLRIESDSDPSNYCEYRILTTTDSGSYHTFTVLFSKSSGSLFADDTKVNMKTGFEYDFTVDWGDDTSSTITSYNDEDITHVYTQEGSYIIRIDGICNGFMVNNNVAIKNMISRVISWGGLVTKIRRLNFYGCSALTSIPEQESQLVYLISFENMFRDCTALRSVPYGTLLGNLIATKASYIFYNCTSIRTIEDTLFDGNILTDLSYAFFGCSKLLSIPSVLFSSLSNLDTLYLAFRGCSALTQIPSGLFDPINVVCNFSYSFYQCTGITELQSGLFSNVLGSNFSYAFYGCTGLTSIAPYLFAYQTECTDFKQTFYNCSITLVPEGLFQGCSSVITFGYNSTGVNNYGTFQSCSKIIEVEQDVFTGCSSVISFNGLFSGCSALTTIPSGLFDDCTAVIYFSNVFYNCSLTSIPEGLFQYNTAVTDFSGAFYYNNKTGCFTSIPQDLFRYCTEVTLFIYTFGYCTKLNTLPGDLFRYNTKVTSFLNTFTNCPITEIPNMTIDEVEYPFFYFNNNVTNFSYTFAQTQIVEIPEDLFSNCTNVLTFSACFYNISTLITIPASLFSTNIAVTDFSQVFYNCTNVGLSIPSGLFDNNVNVQTFYNAFSGTKITSIPSGLFAYAINTPNFSQIFYSCTEITEIPAGLFDNCVAATSFGSTFRSCSKLETIPSNLFRNNTICLDFTSTFSGCNKLQIISDIFYNDGEQSTRFLNKSVNFGNCFNRTSFSGVQGEAPDLWDCDFGTGSIVKTSCFGGAGNSLTSLSNYGDIPSEWK